MAIKFNAAYGIAKEELFTKKTNKTCDQNMLVTSATSGNVSLEPCILRHAYQEESHNVPVILGADWNIFERQMS